MKTLINNATKWIAALAVVPALVLFSACEPQDDDPMVTDPDDEHETEFGDPPRDPADDPGEQPPPPPEDPAEDEDPDMPEQDDDPDDTF